MKLPNAEELFNQLAEAVKPYLVENTAIVGIHSGGAWLSERLVEALGGDIDHGILDSSFYRDDLHQRGLHVDTRPSNIPFEVDNRHILLIDDVFYTGRTIRAAMNELFDYGRPASITLAVLINRGGRELPIAPQIVAYTCTLPEDKKLQLMRDDEGAFYLEIEENY